MCSTATYREQNVRLILSRNIRSLRLRRGWSQEQLAAQCGLHRTYVGAIERGERNLCLDNLQRLAAALQVPPSRLLTESGLAQQVCEVRPGYTPGVPEQPAIPMLLPRASCHIYASKSYL